MAVQAAAEQGPVWLRLLECGSTGDAVGGAGAGGKPWRRVRLQHRDPAAAAAGPGAANTLVGGAQLHARSVQ